MSTPATRALVEGLTDALGFFVGGLLAALLARAIGFDFLEPGYGVRVLIGLLMVGVGGGLGLQAARRFRARLTARDDKRSP